MTARKNTTVTPTIRIVLNAPPDDLAAALLPPRGGGAPKCRGDAGWEMRGIKMEP
jgi:hypothetical protein